MIVSIYLLMLKSLCCKIDLAFLTNAVHRLCMAERWKLDEKMYKSFSNLKISVEKALARCFDEVKDIEGLVTSEVDV